MIDGLTGIPNRRRFDEYLEVECTRARRAGQALSLIMIDIDYFKPFNDNYGHCAGDICIQSVAKKLSECMCRSSDLIARYGGEEFASILPNTELEGSMKIAESMLTGISALQIPHEFSSVDNQVSISLGVSSIAAGSTIGGEKLLAMADEALYCAKDNGRKQIQVIVP